MKVISSHTMQELDRRAINERQIPGLLLMERAGQQCTAEIIAEFGVTGSAVVLAGKGNNGGDGYVIARLLRQRGVKVQVLLLADRREITGDAASCLDRLPAAMVESCTDERLLVSRYGDVIDRADYLVDALFGTGLRGEVSGIHRAAINCMNGSGRPIIAVDIPSGVSGSSGAILGVAVKATVTVTFALAKLGHILYPGAEQVGRLVVADIGIPADLMQGADGVEFLTAGQMAPLVRQRERQTHKGSFGHCLVLAGSTGKSGAASLTANSAVRSGSGLVTVAVPEALHGIMELKTTEAMTVPLPDGGVGHLVEQAVSMIEQLLPGKGVVALGPGLGQHPETQRLVRTLVETVTSPLVVDADGLNAIAQDMPVLLRKKTGQLVVTPHPGEMARLLGSPLPELVSDRIEVARSFANTHELFLILKGARTIIAAPDGRVALNGSGNPGMASGGMGDVLTGIVASLLGQGYPAWDACRLGVFLHGYAADIVARSKGEIGITATDVLEQIPYAYYTLVHKEKIYVNGC